MPDLEDEIRRRLARLQLSPTREAEIVEELSQHVQDRYDDLRAGGASEEDAWGAAVAELDDRDLLADRLAEVERRAPQEPIVLGSGGRPMIESIWHDVKYAARTLRKTPGFTAVVVLTLALGIGATTAIFSVLDGVMLRPLPYPDADRIMILTETTRTGGFISVSWPNFQDWHAQNEVFDHLGVYRGATVNLTGGDQPRRLDGSIGSSELFGALGIQPLAGRTFTSSEDTPRAERVAVISERLWRTSFNADPSLVGRSVVLNGQAHTIVGIMPFAMRFPSRLTDVWLPLGLFVNTFPSDRGAHPGLTAVGRLKAGVGVERANASLDTVARRLEEQYPESNHEHAIAMTPYYEQIVRNIRPALVTLVCAVGFVLLIACANLANLLLSKADQRQREIAIRAALGAERARIVQQLLTESVLMALAGGALGALLAAWGVKAFVASGPSSIPRIDLIAVDVRVLAFVAAVSIATGLIFGIAPAWRASSGDLLTPLKESARTTTGAARRLRGALVVVEVALAIVLLVGAGLTIKSFGRLLDIDPGFKPDHVVTLRLALPDAKYPTRVRWTAFHEDLLRRVSRLPAIEAVGLNSAVPLEGGGAESPVIAEGQPLPSPTQDNTMCLFQATSPDYFRAMGIQLLKGRTFADRDSVDAAPVAIVDESLARRLFHDRDPIGKRIAFEFIGHSTKDGRAIWREVIGVVPHVRHYGLASEPPFVQIYTSYVQLPFWFEERRPSMALVARTALEPETLAASIREQVASIDRDIPVYGIQTMEGYIAQATEQPRLSVILLGGFGALALVLAVLGIYGVLSYSVSQRTQEIGVRMALGATGSDVLRLIVGQGMTLTAAGVAIGLVLSWIVTGFLTKLLFQISPHDPAIFASIALLLAATALVASYLPGRKATRVDPVVALRDE